MTSFAQAESQAVADALGDANDGLTGPEIAHLLAICQIEDVDPALTKRHRLSMRSPTIKTAGRIALAFWVSSAKP